MQILLDASISTSKVASERPITVERSRRFIIDVTNPDDIKKDAYRLVHMQGVTYRRLQVFIKF